MLPAKTFVIEIPEIGSFEIKRLTFELRLKINRFYQVLVGNDDQYLNDYSKSEHWIYSYLKNVIESGPTPDWDLNTSLFSYKDPVEVLGNIYSEVQKREESFRQPRDSSD